MYNTYFNSELAQQHFGLPWNLDNTYILHREKLTTLGGLVRAF